MKVPEIKKLWIKDLLETVAKIDHNGQQVAEYIYAHNVKIGFWKANISVGAFWTIFGNIRINSRHYDIQKPFDNPYLLSLIVHEVRHLQQGFFTALSVYGELDAWQVGFRVYREIKGHYPKRKGAQEIMSLPLGWDRDVLRRARILMQDFAGKGYRADLLPLYPLGKEMRFRITGKFD
jgi:hypothetical protein